MRKKVVACLATLGFSYSFAFAAMGKPAVRYAFLFNHDIRHSDENFYSNRLEAVFGKVLNSGCDYRPVMKLKPFVEIRHSQQRSKKERLATGIEAGIDLTDFLYIGQQLRHLWRSEPVYNRGVIKNTNMTEGLSIVTLSRWLTPRKKLVKGYISGEYTYDFRLGRGSRIESVAGLLIPAGKSCELNLDWRHRDRIHADDCDTIEGSVSYLF